MNHSSSLFGFLLAAIKVKREPPVEEREQKTITSLSVTYSNRDTNWWIHLTKECIAHGKNGKISYFSFTWKGYGNGNVYCSRVSYHVKGSSFFPSYLPWPIRVNARVYFDGARKKNIERSWNEYSFHYTEVHSDHCGGTNLKAAVKVPQTPPRCWFLPCLVAWRLATHLQRSQFEFCVVTGCSDTIDEWMNNLMLVNFSRGIDGGLEGLFLADVRATSAGSSGTRWWRRRRRTLTDAPPVTTVVQGTDQGNFSPSVVLYYITSHYPHHPLRCASLYEPKLFFVLFCLLP